MPDFTESAAGRAQDGKGSSKVLGAAPQRLLKTLLLPMLPLLSLQRNTLPIIRAGLQRDTDDYIKTIDKFALLEMHALMMILDPERKLRGRFNENLEKDLAAELAQIFEKLSASLINVIEVQELILSRVIDVLKEAKNEKHGNNEGSVLLRLSDILTGTLNRKSGTNIEVILSRVEDILSEAKKGNSGSSLEAILSRLADVLNTTKSVNISGAAQVGVSRLIETLRNKAALSRLIDVLKQLKSGSDAKHKNDNM